MVWTATAGTVLGLLLLGSTTAHAQKIDRQGIPYRPWDVGLTGGLHVDREVTDASTGFPGGSPGAFNEERWVAAFQVQADVGRYWNSHVRTDLSFGTVTRRELFGSVPVDVPLGVATAYAQTLVSRKQLGAGLTYQFLENVFAHPYVSAGLRATVVDSHTIRQPSAWLMDGRSAVSIPIPPLEWDRTEVMVRPYLAAGFKSYFNERAFLRTEFATAYDTRGLSQWTARLGAGVDF